MLLFREVSHPVRVHEGCPRPMILCSWRGVDIVGLVRRSVGAHEREITERERVMLGSELSVGVPSISLQGLRHIIGYHLRDAPRRALIRWIQHEKIRVQADLLAEDGLDDIFHRVHYTDSRIVESVGCSDHFMKLVVEFFLRGRRLTNAKHIASPNVERREMISRHGIVNGRSVDLTNPEVDGSFGFDYFVDEGKRIWQPKEGHVSAHCLDLS
mmetsp:Transcript_3189/g.5802  ORF Transcript_3189/g.5802 Transcript_3189/m.5802 type:complete len:213 (-) Transcript_3189:332-970(-)